MVNTFHNSHFVRYYHSLFVVRDTKYIQNHSSMTIILCPENEQKLLKKMDDTPSC